MAKLTAKGLFCLVFINSLLLVIFGCLYLINLPGEIGVILKGPLYLLDDNSLSLRMIGYGLILFCFIVCNVSVLIRQKIVWIAGYIWVIAWIAVGVWIAAAFAI